jgi:NOL1/NOP2/sun family putative RNA methylase
VITHLPETFILEINRLLGEEASRFWDVFNTQPPVSGLRVNSLKTNLDQIQGSISSELKRLPWVKDGYQLLKDTKLGKHPFHAAGLFYLQEPSAMAPVDILDPQPGELILDLCAAPGGKTTQILALMENQGVLVANDANPRRVLSLTRNVERWGACNALITCERPEKLTNRFGPIFDRVLVDAPCSGEGTFRAEPGEVKKWSTRFTERCSAIQDELLWFASKMVRPGGILVYSTCTFNQRENEGSVSRFLGRNSDFILDPIPLQPGFSPGIPLSDNDPEQFHRTARIWPHLSPGEGHFIARMRRSGNRMDGNMAFQSLPDEMNSNYQGIYDTFFDSTLVRNQRTERIAPDQPSLAIHGKRLYRIPEGSPSLAGLRVFHWGWWLGTVQSNRFIPSPAMAAGLTKEDSQLVIEFQLDDPDLVSYLRGSPIPYSGERTTEKTWALVAVEEFPLGWGRIVHNQLKSYIPDWLRQSN